MPIGDLVSNKIISLALQGYNPFQPDCGIYCGGTQGIIYPNPTTLISPSTDFRPQDHREPIASIYNILPPYNGLGIGNPGIDYKNPGHILGLLDTFCRMSYGISILQSIHDGIDIIGSVTPSVAITLPTKDVNLISREIKMSDIYPSLSEVPNDWLSYFTVDPTTGAITPDIRPWIPFTVGSPYSPIVNPVNTDELKRLFTNISVFSYQEIITYFRIIIETLYTAIQPLATKTTTSFTLTNAKHFDTFTHDTWMPDYDDSNYDGTSIIDEGTYSHQCAILTPQQALNALTKSNAYHDSDQPNQFEYRSLVEINSSINLVPIQAAGALFQSDIIYPIGGGISDLSLHGFWIYAFTIIDVMINLSESEADLGTVSVNGDVTIKGLITDPSPFYTEAEYREISDPPQVGWAEAGATGDTTTTEYDILQRSKKRVDMRAILTNKHSFDKNWLDTESDEQYYVIGEERDILLSQGDIDISDFIVPFSKIFNFNAGCNSLKMRFIIRNKHFIQPDPDMSRYLPEDSWSEYSELLPAPWYAIILEQAEPGDIWTWYPGGTQSCGYINNPDTLRGSIVSPSIILSLSITSPGRDSIVREISI